MTTWPSLHPATMELTKLELLTSWLPGRPGYLGDPMVPLLTEAGGFRLDDPEGRSGWSSWPLQTLPETSRSPCGCR
jgi:hypothetical protein